MIGIYIHIPYCRTLCPYCDFVKERTSTSVPKAYLKALCAEIERFGGPDEAGSVFFGGGTPSLLPPKDLAEILDALRRRFRFTNPEITIEANPDDVTPALVHDWRNTGINRVSLGVQSFDDAVLRYLGRRHDASAARRACEAVAAVFNTWSLDLIYGAPPNNAWERTLDQCLELDPPHVAAYGLTYEPGTPFARRMDNAVEDDVSLALYQVLERKLAAYDHYEISNFAKTGHASKHNLVYWRNTEYAGFGTAAYSFIDGIRARNVIDTTAYLNAPGTKMEALILSEEEIRLETVIQHMRLREGLPKAAYRDRFGADVNEHFGDALTALLARGLVEESQTHFHPTARGFYLNNEIGLALVG